MPVVTIEDRILELEKEVAKLKEQLERLTGSSNGNWIEKISGGMEGNPAFAEAMRLGAEIRRSDCPPDES